MTSGGIAIIITLLTLVFYMIPGIPLTVTTVLAMLAMAFFGIISFEEAFSGFASSATLLVTGMLIIGQACFSTGLAEEASRLLKRFKNLNERNLALIILLFSCALGVFLNGSLIVPLMLTIVDCVVSQSDGKFTRKNLYFPVGIGATLGNNMTTISGTSMITALGIYYAAGYGMVGLFEPMLVNLPAFIVSALVYWTFGYQVSQKVLDYEDIPVVSQKTKDDKEKPKWKIIVTAIVLILVTVMMISGINYGASALAGASVLILTGCISEKDALKNISWRTVIIVGGAIGISNGFTASGAGEICAKFLLGLLGDLGNSPFAVCVMLFIAGTLVSNVMSDNAAVAILVPIAIGLAEKLGVAPLPFVFASAFGIKVAVSTPIAVSTMTMLQPAGYRFKDYLCIGGLINLTMMLISCAMLKLIYF